MIIGLLLRTAGRGPMWAAGVALVLGLSSRSVLPQGLHSSVASDGTRVEVRAFSKPTADPGSPGSGLVVELDSSTCPPSEPVQASPGDTTRANDRPSVPRRVPAMSTGHVVRVADFASGSSAGRILRIGFQSGIIGPHNELALVNAPRSFPARAVVSITSSFLHSSSSVPSIERCTGWMYGESMVATAGHCLHTGPLPAGEPGFWAREVVVTPARDGDDMPFGRLKAKRLYSVAGWTNGRSENADYGAILLDCSIGTRTGWFGYGWSTGSRKRMAVVHAGYPNIREYPSLTQDFRQRSAPGTVMQERDGQVFYDADSWGQMSGGPVFTLEGCVNCVVGIQSHIKHEAGKGQPPYTTWNHGVGITRSVFENLKAWKTQP